jgi:hypothetical protein
MPRPRAHRHYLTIAKEEALLACDLYNQRRRSRNLEAFIVHMSIAWLNLFLAMCARSGIDCCYRDGRRLQRVDGEAKAWDITKCLNYFFPNANQPIRANLTFFIRLRNKIEHRFSEKQRRHLEPIVAAKAQALILNFEKTLVEEFGSNHSLGDYLRFPIFLSSLTSYALEAIKTVYSQVPRDLKTFIETYDEAQDDAVRKSEAYEYRIYLMPKVSSKGKADLAVEFIDVSKAPPEQVETIERAQVIIRERKVPIANINMLKASEVVSRLQQVFSAFKMHMHVWAWKRFKVRPSYKSDDPAHTDTAYCVYDRAHGDYVYTEAWVTKLKDELKVDPGAAIRSWSLQ